MPEKQLTRDAVAAFKAGMHYGDYMAQKSSPVPVARSGRATEAPKYCPTCGAEIVDGDPRKVYCSKRCSQKAYYHRKANGGDPNVHP